MKLGPLLLRPYVYKKTKVHGLISKSKCWHFDAWIMRGLNDHYLKVETRDGGRILTSLTWYKVIEKRDGTLSLRYDATGPGRSIPVHINGELLDDYDRWNALHWDLIVPMTKRVPQGYFPSTSVRLWYIGIPIGDPFDLPGFRNYWKYERKTPHALADAVTERLSSAVPSQTA